MYRSNIKNTKQGFTLIELLVVVAIIGVLAAIVLVSLNSSRVKSENLSIIRQVREYTTALELTYKANGDSYPFRSSPATTLTQYGCIVDTIGTGNCVYNNSSVSMYPDPAGLAVLGTMINLAPLDVVIEDNQGHIFDAVTYSTNGTNYRLRYTLRGENADCGLGGAFVIATAGINFPGVTVCVFQSS